MGVCEAAVIVGGRALVRGHGRGCTLAAAWLLVGMMTLTGCAEPGQSLDPDKWQRTVSDYLHLKSREKALVLDLDSYQSYWTTNNPNADVIAMGNCRRDGRRQCTVAYRGNQPVLDVSRYYTPSGPSFSMGDFAQLVGGLQAGLSGQPYVPPDSEAGDDDEDAATTPASAAAQQSCLPNPPQCSAVGARGKNYLANIETRLQSLRTPAAGMAGMKAYCVNRLQAEIARVCSNEYRANGLASCASLAQQQMNENLRVAEGAKATVAAYTTGSWEEDCGW